VVGRRVGTLDTDTEAVYVLDSLAGEALHVPVVVLFIVALGDGSCVPVLVAVAVSVGVFVAVCVAPDTLIVAL
jgi:hypothetical protein